jgi:hypothetical protein
MKKTKIVSIVAAIAMIGGVIYSCSKADNDLSLQGIMEY